MPIRTSIEAVGPQLLSAMLGLNETQSGALAITFRKTRDDGQFILTLNDLRWALNDILELREEVCRKYGNITSSSIAAIQRGILTLEAQGGHALFGEPPFAIDDFIRTEEGRGVVNLLRADKLLEAPKLYATFLLWLLTELFRTLPEIGDPDKPHLVFFFDEAHLLFTTAPKPLLQSIERLVRLVRSKGVGIYFVSQSPADIPDAVLAQLGNRIQHALRAYTPKDQKLIKAAANAFRPNPDVKVKDEITMLAVGEALISVMESDGVPTPVEKAKILPPSGQIGPITNLERECLVKVGPLNDRYSMSLDESEAQARFTDRMRKTHGLPEIERDDSNWEEGEFQNFLPDIESLETDEPRKRTSLLSVVTAFGIAAACFWFAGVF